MIPTDTFSVIPEPPKSKRTKAKSQESFAPPIDSGTIVVDNFGVNAGGVYGTVLDIEGSIKTESDLIRKYREIAEYPDVDNAIENIVNEAISDLDNDRLVELDLKELDLSAATKKKISNEFKELTNLLNFEIDGHNIFKRFYIDGRIYYHKIIDETKPSDGIQELRFLDPRKMKRVSLVSDKSRNKRVPNAVASYSVDEEFFVYTPNAVVTNGRQSFSNGAKGAVKIPIKDIAFATSGWVDHDLNLVRSYLHKAIRPVNQLKMVEDSLVIQRLVNAPQRRVFYVDVGNMSKVNSEAHIRNQMTLYRNKAVYDPVSGEIKDDRKFAALTEDFWVPRQNGSNATQIDTLQSSGNLGQIEDIEYFQKKLFQSLSVPLSRLSDTGSIAFGRQTEVTRDEIAFSKFVQRLRGQFQTLFLDILKTQLILKNIVTEVDWDNFFSDIKFVFTEDSYYAEAKASEIMRNRLEMVTEMTPYIGVFFSRKYIQSEILKLTEEQIKEIDNEINTEKSIILSQPPVTEMQMQLQQQYASMPTSPTLPGSGQPGKTVQNYNEDQ